jgi:hypothetical protein
MPETFLPASIDFGFRRVRVSHALCAHDQEDRFRLPSWTVSDRANLIFYASSSRLGPSSGLVLHLRKWA